MLTLSIMGAATMAIGLLPTYAAIGVASPALLHLFDVERAVRASQVVLCCTSAPTPLFDGDWVGDGACVVAMGSHFPDQRELDGSLVGRSLVVVEDRATALREAGDRCARPVTAARGR
ncbi:hypothetical protein [Enemella dayhoffiae]|uniref:hypothetical protein n=1 Tax=Enemella dayhoffiae TaxID=2016507 RepID=UPI001E59F5B7|nr:hypothetical protein [Enemella dayhoffiae]